MTAGESTCSVAGCSLATTARGFCKRHYQRWHDGKDVAAPFASDRKQCADCGSPIAGGTTRVRCPPCVKVHALKTFNAKGYARRSRFGISPEEFARRLEEQGGRCAICRSDDPRGKGWHLDHDHKKDAKDPSGHRGVLCTPCNMGIGCLQDDELLIERAIAYLRSHKLKIRLVSCA